MNKTSGKDVLRAFPDQEQWDDVFCFKRYVDIGNGRYVKKYSGLRNRPKLKTYLRNKYIRRLAKDELELPDLLRTDVVINYNYDRELQDEWDSFQAGRSVSSSAKARSAFVSAPFTARYCKDLYKGKRTPILIFTDHRKACARISEELNCPKIMGGMPERQRHRLVKEFQKGRHKHLVGTIGALKEGNTMTAARDCVFNDESWVPGDNSQAIFRIYRIGQDRECMVHRIQGSRTHLSISKTLQEKEEDLKEAM